MRDDNFDGGVPRRRTEGLLTVTNKATFVLSTRVSFSVNARPMSQLFVPTFRDRFVKLLFCRRRRMLLARLH